MSFSNLKPALITSACGSCHHVNSDVLAKLFPSDMRHATDYYMLMAVDAHLLLPRILRNRGPNTRRQPHNDIRSWTALEFLAEMSIQELDFVTDHFFKLLPQHARKVVALSSFLPEIAADPKSPQAVAAIRAVTALIGIAAGFCQRTRHAPVVELVAGSRAERIVHWDSVRNHYVILRSWDGTAGSPPSPKPEVFDGPARIVHAIELAIEEAHRRGFMTTIERAGQVLRLGLEAEPGDWFWLNTQASLERFLEHIDGSSASKLHLGFNLDISHWCLGGFDVEKFRNDPMLYSRIVHSHISGHSRRGHFGDFSLRLCTPEEREQCWKWLRLLDELASPSSTMWSECRQRNREGWFSGYVSVEYEAARSLAEVIESMRTLEAWLA